MTVLNKYKIDNNIEGNINFQEDNFNIEIEKKQLGKVFFSMSSNQILKKTFEDTIGIDIYNELPLEYKDDIITGLTFYKTDTKIESYFKEEEIEGQTTSTLNWSMYPQIVKEVIPKIPGASFKESASMSFKVLNQLNKKMIEGFEYDKAMKELGYDHSKIDKNVLKGHQLKNLKEILDEQFPQEISNPRVVRVLARTCSLINSCIAKYGIPQYINIEVARDINLTAGKRREIETEQLNNLTTNERLKQQIRNDYPNINYSRISKYDLEKYKLYNEQNGICPYSLEKISKGDILSEIYEVDHIIPYSRLNDNSIKNKTLVKRMENQKKSNMTPMEYFTKVNSSKIEKYRNFIENNHNISDKKKTYYLIKDVSNLEENFTGGAIEQTRFITKYLVDILKNNLDMPVDQTRINKDGNIIEEPRIVSRKAGYVRLLKRAAQISNYTHSLENENYLRKNYFTFQEFKITKDKKENIEAKFFVQNISSKDKLIVELKTKKEGTKTPEHIKNENSALQKVYDNIEKLNLEALLNVQIEDKRIGKNDFFDLLKEQNLGEHFEKVFTLLKSEVHKKSIKKNRDNHLHHALDALAVATLTTSVEQKIAKYIKQKEQVIERLKEAKNGVYIKYGSQERVIKKIEEFNEIEYEYMRELFPMPFDGFQKEIQAFVYERDNEVQKEMIKDHKIRNIRPLIPVIKKKRRYTIIENKIEVPILHKDTVFGVRGENLIKRISVKEINDKKIEKIYGKETHGKETYLSVKNWYKNKDEEYPTLNGGRQIKKVRIEDGDANKALKIDRGYVAGDDVVRIDVYKKENDDKLYFLGHNAFTIVKDFQGEKINQILWYGSGDDNSILLTNKKIKEQFIKIIELHPGDLIQLTKVRKKELKTGLCYIKGFTGGKLAIESVIGDNYDLAVYFDATRSQSKIEISVSTIKQIQKMKINIRGELQ